MNRLSSTTRPQTLFETYLCTRARVPLLSENGTLHPEALILYFHTLQQEDRIDSRILFSFLIHHTTAKQPFRTHSDWMMLAKTAHATAGEILFREMDLRSVGLVSEFLLVNWLQAAVLVVSALRAEPFPTEHLVEQVFDFAALHWSQRLDLETVIPLLPLVVSINETIEGIQQRQNQGTNAKWKRHQKTIKKQTFCSEKKRG